MIYDRILEVFDLDTASSPLARRLVLRAVHFCAPVTVYHRTYYESLQAGQTVDLMVRIPDPFGAPPAATQYAVPGDGHVYRITEVQAALDEDGRPVANISLHREETRYDLFRPGDSAQNSDVEDVPPGSTAGGD